MLSIFLSNSPANMSLLVMLAKATIILVAAIGITMAMQRASAGARHLVWLVTLGALLLVPALATWAPLRLRILPPVAASATSNNANTASPRSDPPAAPANFLRAPQSGVTRISVANAPTLVPASSTVLASLGAMS